MLDLAGIPLLSSTRNGNSPLVIAGGHATLNPEPMAEYIDAFVIGEGEDVILEIVECLRKHRSKGSSKSELFQSLSKLWGLYVPSLYEVHDLEDGTLSHVEKIDPSVQLPVIKRPSFHRLQLNLSYLTSMSLTIEFQSKSCVGVQGVVGSVRQA